MYLKRTERWQWQALVKLDSGVVLVQGMRGRCRRVRAMGDEVVVSGHKSQHKKEIDAHPGSPEVQEGY